MPDPQTLAALASVPSALAVIVTVTLFLKHDADQRDKVRADVADQRKQDRTVWENHLSQSIAVQSKTTEAIGELVTAIKVMQTQNDSSLQWAREAIQSLIREIGRSQPVKE